MNKLLRSFWLRLLLEERGEVAVTSEPAALADPAPASSDPVPVSTDPAPASDPAQGTTDPNSATVDPNDPLAALTAAMDAQFGADEPASDPNAAPEPQAGAVPAEFAKALEISPYVKSPETLNQAVSAANEVWDVANGKAPASSLLEGMRAANPEGFQRVVENLIPYFEQITGKKFGEAAPVDPVQAKLAEIEQRFATQEQERQQAVAQQQMRAADEKGWEFVTSKLKGTYAEGQENFMMPLIAAKLNGNPAAMQEILSGNTKTLEAAIRSVNKDLAPVIKAFNANLIKQSRTLQNAVPAGKGNPATKGDQKSKDPLPGESAVDHATRLWKNGIV